MEPKKTRMGFLAGDLQAGGSLNDLSGESAYEFKPGGSLAEQLEAAQAECSAWREAAAHSLAEMVCFNLPLSIGRPPPDPASPLKVLLERHDGGVVFFDRLRMAEAQRDELLADGEEQGRIRVERDRLRAEVERIKEDHPYPLAAEWRGKCAALKAENERLSKGVRDIRVNAGLEDTSAADIALVVGRMRKFCLENFDAYSRFINRENGFVFCSLHGKPLPCCSCELDHRPKTEFYKPEFPIIPHAWKPPRRVPAVLLGLLLGAAVGVGGLLLMQPELPGVIGRWLDSLFNGR